MIIEGMASRINFVLLIMLLMAGGCNSQASNLKNAKHFLLVVKNGDYTSAKDMMDGQFKKFRYIDMYLLSLNRSLNLYGLPDSKKSTISELESQGHTILLVKYLLRSDETETAAVEIAFEKNKSEGKILYFVNSYEGKSLLEPTR
jgi:endo-alpha-1,4-polygalactosaminidase (GH114 family)